MPRGVRTEHTRDGLLDAADRIVARDGPAGLSVRSITSEAGVAVGVLYNHFDDLDELVASDVLRHLAAFAEQPGPLAGRAGASSVTRNLDEFCRTLLESPAARLLGLVIGNEAIEAKIDAAVAAGHPDPGQIEAVLAGYLREEQAIGRVNGAIDAGEAAAVLFGAWHQIIIDGPPDALERANRATAVIFAGLRP